MKDLIYKIAAFSILVFGTFIIFPVEKREFLIMLLGLGAIIYFIRKRQFKFSKIVLINSSLFLVFMVTLIYTPFEDGVFKRFETLGSLIIVPLIFSIFYQSDKTLFSDKIRTSFFWVFYGSSIIFSLIVIFYFINLGYFSSSNAYGYYLSNLMNELPLLADHPIYISMTLGIAVLLSLHELKNKKSSKKIIFLILFFNVFLVLMVLFLSRKGVILALVLALLTWFVLQYRTSKKLMLFSTISIIFIASVLMIIPSTQKRVIELFEEQTYSTTNETNSTNNRLQIYKCTVSLIKEKPIFGYGLIKDRKALYKCYQENLYYLYENKFNTHNQYLSILLKAGVFGFLIFLYFLFYNFKLSYLNHEWEFFAILIFFSVLMLFENIIERQNGVMLFTFLINFFAFKNITKLPHKI